MIVLLYYEWFSWPANSKRDITQLFAEFLELKDELSFLLNHASLDNK